jgi:CBS domain-containing protein
MKLREIMTQNVETAELMMSLQEAATKMKTLNVGSLPVRQGMQLVGMITDRDITIRGVAEGGDPLTTTVSALMTADIIFCFEDQEVREAVRMMAENQIRRLPIINRDHQLVGIVSLGDLVAVEVGDKNLKVKALKEISQPAEPTPRNGTHS